MPAPTLPDVRLRAQVLLCSDRSSHSRKEWYNTGGSNPPVAFTRDVTFRVGCLSARTVDCPCVTLNPALVGRRAWRRLAGIHGFPGEGTDLKYPPTRGPKINHFCTPERPFPKGFQTGTFPKGLKTYSKLPSASLRQPPPGLGFEVPPHTGPKINHFGTPERPFPKGFQIGTFPKGLKTDSKRPSASLRQPPPVLCPLQHNC